ncbi:MAG: hypothetical protein J4N80_07815, partial [Chloroflexi bacterium]|nr:hypothetical protein [Chloroflexota bacterium]
LVPECNTHARPVPYFVFGRNVKMFEHVLLLDPVSMTLTDFVFVANGKPELRERKCDTWNGRDAIADHPVSSQRGAPTGITGWCG